MVHVRERLFLYASCTRQLIYNFQGRATAELCEKHAQDGMVDVQGWRCSRGFPVRRPRFNVKANITATYYRKHYEAGMVYGYYKHC